MTDTITSEQAHITPLWIYFSVAGTLLVLTFVTVAVAQIDMGEWNILVALSVAAVKAILVLLFFMHLLYDNKIFALVFSSAIIFLAVFIVLTMMDTQSRAAIYPVKSTLIQAQADIYSPAAKTQPPQSGVDHALAAWEKMRVSEEYIFSDARSTYTKYCAVCHGEQGQGDGFNAFNLDPKPKSFSDSAVVKNFNDDYLYRVIAEGGEGVGLSASMPPYGRNLSQEEIRRLTLFVRALSEVE